MNTYRRKIDELEADLYPIPKTTWDRIFNRSKTGEMEIKRYEGGEKRMEIDLKKIKVPDGAMVEALIDNRVVRQVEVRKGWARIRISSLDGEEIPEAQHGSTAQIRYQGEVLAEGTFRLD